MPVGRAPSLHRMILERLEPPGDAAPIAAFRRWLWVADEHGRAGRGERARELLDELEVQLAALVREDASTLSGLGGSVEPRTLYGPMIEVAMSLGDIVRARDYARQSELDAHRARLYWLELTYRARRREYERIEEMLERPPGEISPVEARLEAVRRVLAHGAGRPAMLRSWLDRAVASLEEEAADLGSSPRALAALYARIGARDAIEELVAMLVARLPEAGQPGRIERLAAILALRLAAGDDEIEATVESLVRATSGAPASTAARAALERAARDLVEAGRLDAAMRLAREVRGRGRRWRIFREILAELDRHPGRVDTELVEGLDELGASLAARSAEWTVLFRWRMQWCRTQSCRDAVFERAASRSDPAIVRRLLEPLADRGTTRSEALERARALLDVEGRLAVVERAVVRAEADLVGGEGLEVFLERMSERPPEEPRARARLYVVWARHLAAESRCAEAGEPLSRLTSGQALHESVSRHIEAVFELCLQSGDYEVALQALGAMPRGRYRRADHIIALARELASRLMPSTREIRRRLQELGEE
jgi:hypothetical protein